MRLPRDISGGEFPRAPGVLDCRVTRQTGSHLRQTTFEPGEHHVTIPALRVSTLAGILGDATAHFASTRDERLFGR